MIHAGKCDCGGYYVFTGEIMTSIPALYKNKCDQCDKIKFWPIETDLERSLCPICGRKMLNAGAYGQSCYCCGHIETGMEGKNAS